MRSFCVAAAALAACFGCAGPSGSGSRLSGVVRADETSVVAPASGILAKLAVREGDSVEAGDLLAVIAPATPAAESERLDTLAAAADRTLAEARERRIQAERDLEGAQAEADRSRRQVVGGRLIETSSDTALLRWDLAKSRLMVAQALESSAAQAATGARAAGAAQPARALAPSGGEVAVLGGPLGRAVRAGEALATLYAPSSLWVAVAMEESLVASIRPGDALRTELADGRELVGTVESVRPAPAFAVQRDVDRRRRDIRAFEVKLRLPAAEGLRPGMTAYVRIPGR